MLARIIPKTMEMALPNIGMKAKKAIHAPLPLTKRSALSNFSFFTWYYFSIHTILPKCPIQ